MDLSMIDWFWRAAACPYEGRSCCGCKHHSHSDTVNLLQDGGMRWVWTSHQIYASGRIHAEHLYATLPHMSNAYVCGKATPLCPPSSNQCPQQGSVKMLFPEGWCCLFHLQNCSWDFHKRVAHVTFAFVLAQKNCGNFLTAYEAMCRSSRASTSSSIHLTMDAVLQ